MNSRAICSKLAVLILLFVLAGPVGAQEWMATSAPSNRWVSVCSSADGRRLAGAVGGGYSLWWQGPIYVSTNAGVYWSLTSAPTQNWASVVCSADGMKLAAAVHSDYFGLGGGQLYTSSDGGGTWVLCPDMIQSWRALAASSDGTKLVAVASFATSVGGPRGRIFASTNWGASWMQAEVPDISWYWVSSQQMERSWRRRRCQPAPFIHRRSGC